VCFHSYSHDSREHCDRVLAFAQQLRFDGINAELDQFHQRELVHWPSWCEERLRRENSKYVLCVCTAEYLGRVQNRVGADVGKGVFWEGRLIYDYIYDAKENDRFVPIFLGAEGDDCVPLPLRGYTRFQLKTFPLNGDDPDYEGLYGLLTGEPKVKPEPLGQPISLLEEGALFLLQRSGKQGRNTAHSGMAKYVAAPIYGLGENLWACM
jgi:hypothetical protein